MLNHYRCILLLCLSCLVLPSALFGATLVADFEDLSLSPGSYWDGSDGSGGFFSDNTFFDNAYDGYGWGCFYSTVNDTNTEGYSNQYAVWTPGVGVGGTGIYSVIYDNAWGAESDVVTFPMPCSVKGFYVNNTTYAALSMMNGDLYAKKFGGASGDDADWFLLTITGRDGDGSSLGTVDFYLADYRFETNSQDYIVGEWTWVDLASLGPDVRSLHFALTSSDTGMYGMNTPAYFAMDGLETVPRPTYQTADFDELPLEAGEYWDGSDGTGGFCSEHVFFDNTYDGYGWGCFYSTVNDTNTEGYSNQYAVWTPGVGVGGTGVYSVIYDNAWGAESDVMRFPFAVRVNGFYINNTTYAALSMMNGDLYAKKFGGASGDDADWFLLTITGKDGEGASLGTVDFYLADYRFETNSQDYIVGEWTWVDLASLGPDVRSLHFALTSSDTGMYGMNTPAYFAMDGIDFMYSFSGGLDDTNFFDGPLPSFVGDAGDGLTNAPNYLNPAFAGWATGVADYSPAPDVAAEWTNVLKTLGPATGDQMDIASLGDLSADQVASNVPVGTLTLTFDNPICDEDGPDFAVFENGLGSRESMFAELGYVEVSSDGANFARLPSVSLATNAVGAFDNMDVRSVYNLCGKHRNNAGISWGTPIDLGDLVCHELVTNGTVDLANITHVRIVDIPGTGDFFDGFSPPNAIYDPSVTIGSGGVDFDALGVINTPVHERIELKIHGPGRITPYGIPVVSVPTGSNATFTITADGGHHILDVLVNGASVGVTSGYTFTNVQSDQLLEVYFGNILQVVSSYGIGIPAIGAYYGYGATTASIEGSPVEDGTTQFVCVGWTGTGSVPNSGSIAHTGEFNLTNDSELTWCWATNYWFSGDATRGGSVSLTGCWTRLGGSVTSSASVDLYYQFAGWSGDTEGDTNALVMTNIITAPETLTAGFWAEHATNYVPVAWLEAYGLTNGLPGYNDDATNDVDGDGLDAWEEFYAGTDPNSSTSVFRIVEQGLIDGTNYVIWIGGTNGSALPFSVYGCTNLVSGWSVLDGSVQRSASGTNRWWHHSPNEHIYYSIRINTGD